VGAALFFAPFFGGNVTAQQLSSPNRPVSTDKNTLSVDGDAAGGDPPISICPAEFGAQFDTAGLLLVRAQWAKLVADWLIFKRSRSDSRHTERAYRLAIARWQAHLAACQLELCQAQDSTVRAWQQSLRRLGLSASTVNHYLAAVSSFYTFALHEPGSTLAANPFRGNVARTPITPYAGARPLTLGEYDQLLTWLEAHAADDAAGARSHALVRTYLHTGWRSAELLRMRWGDLRPHRTQRHAYIYAWQGKGGKRQDDLLPADCADAIVEYLQCAGHWPAAPGDFVFRPVRLPTMTGLRSQPQADGADPISPSSALRILRSALAGAGIDQPRRFRIHDLRHTHAHLLLAAGHNLATVQSRLHHSSLATTGIYARTVFRDDPEDNFSDGFRNLRKPEMEWRLWTRHKRPPTAASANG
jgi:site-specific recombinase XerD